MVANTAHVQKMKPPIKALPLLLVHVLVGGKGPSEV